MYRWQPLCVFLKLNYDFAFFSAEASGGIELKAEKRPDWALFGKVNENMETVLFREKFLDWPDASNIIKVKGQDDDHKVNLLLLFSMFIKNSYFMITGKKLFTESNKQKFGSQHCSLMTFLMCLARAPLAQN